MLDKKIIAQRFTRLFAALALSVVCSFSLFAQDSTREIEGREKKFDAGEMILHHIADAHEIHIIGDLVIYLPVIVYSENALDIFSSSRLYHSKHHFEKTTPDGKVSEEHYYTHKNYVMYHEHIYTAGPDGGIGFDPETGEVVNAAVTDLSITKTVAGLFLTCAILLFVFISTARAYGKRKGQAPKGLQSFMEPLVLFIRDEVAIPSIGAHKADRFMPFLLTVFFFIWIANMLGLIPFIGGFNVTGTMSVTIVLAVIVFIITTLSANKHYWGHILWPPGVPLPIKFILVPIEVLGIFIKPAVLMIRLTANITAGHIIILSFVSLVLIFSEAGVGAEIGVGIGSTLFMIFMFFIELLVAFLQAYVFTLLAALYFGDATQEAHH